jgi:hypothetical protein
MFDALLCRNWLFSPPNCLTLQITLSPWVNVFASMSWGISHWSYSYLSISINQCLFMSHEETYLSLHVIRKCMGNLSLAIILPFNHLNQSMFFHVKMTKCFCLFISCGNDRESPIGHPICPFIINPFIYVIKSKTFNS